jgi:hypothetical protein
MEEPLEYNPDRFMAGSKLYSGAILAGGNNIQLVPFSSDGRLNPGYSTEYVPLVYQTFRKLKY